MQKNVTIFGLLGDVKIENCKQKVIKFLWDVMMIPVEEKEIFVAHCIGRMISESGSRLMVVRFLQDLKQ